MLTKIPSSIEDSNKEMHISWAVNQEITYIFNSHSGVPEEFRNWVMDREEKGQAAAVIL